MRFVGGQGEQAASAAGSSVPPQPPLATQQIEVLFREHNLALVSFLTAKLRSEQEAREVAQESYVRLLRLDRHTGESFLRAHLFHIAGNIAIDRLRQRTLRSRVQPRELFDETLSSPSPEYEALAREEIDVLRQALDQLPSKVARMFVEHTLMGRDVRSIAREWATAERTVRHHIAKALEHCRLALEQFRKAT
jgi:RNA polymerase sigma factor (sigma-70 family)